MPSLVIRNESAKKDKLKDVYKFALPVSGRKKYSQRVLLVTLFL